MLLFYLLFFFFFKQKTAYEMRISDWSSDVCSSDLHPQIDVVALLALDHLADRLAADRGRYDLHHVSDIQAIAGQCLMVGAHDQLGLAARSAERGVGNGCVSTCSIRWTPSHYKQKNKHIAEDSNIYTRHSKKR